MKSRFDGDPYLTDDVPGPPLVDEEARAEVAKEAALMVDPELKEEKDKKKDEPLATAKQVFSFGAGRKKRICLTLGLICAFVSGCIFPLMAFLFAKAFENLSATATSEDFLEEVRNMAFYFMGLGVAAFVFMSGQATFLETAAGLMTLDFKTQWFDALLRQDMAYYDIKDVSGCATIISNNASKYKKGLGRKLGAALQFFVTFLGGLVYAFYASWRISLIILTTVPVLVASTLFLLKTNQTQSARASEGYAEAGSIVQTTVASIRTVLSLNAVRAVIDKYAEATQKAFRQSVRLLHLLGAANGAMMASMVLGYVVVALYGAYLLYDSVRQDGCDPSAGQKYNTPCDPSGTDVFGSLMGITFAATVLPQVQVGVEAFTDARAACFPAIQVINRKVGDDDNDDSSTQATGPARRSSVTPLPKYVIDSSSHDGLKLPNVLGNIEFQNVKFAYPTRQEANVFDGFSLFIEAGSTVALVGPSGCGKSTVVSLLERFYDVLGGSIKLDFHDIRDLNVHWLRKQIGLVSQEPTLFACSIRDNIAYGNPHATDEQICEAARMANAHDFIVSFPDGYDTQVGDKGAQISGGQKQRIAIARVLVKNPKILLLDESTSALDTESELIVQSALDSVVAEQKRTTIVIAHRLSTIQSADMICVVEDGRIVETGNHDELMAIQGHYFKLVEAQQLRERVEGSSHSGPPSRNPSFVDLQESIALRNTPVIMFRDVWFSYPSRPDIDIFRGLNLSVFPGESLALVGPSGHGKSTTVQLIERFYDPDGGSVELDGVDLREINVAWLREQFALVSQEPVLFDTSINENIRLSRLDATMEEIENAARQANAYDFIVSFPDGFDTQVGEGGAAVSGGQKQRIAMARALLRQPRILLLDEATSALDSKSEKVVQEALDNIMASKSLTTIVIAHRLSTVQKCDRIAVVAEGKVREIGTHDELMAIPDGRYRRMQAFQSFEGAEALSAPLRAKTNLTGTADEVEPNKEDIEIDEEDDDLAKEKEKSNARRARLLAKDDRWLFVIGGFGALLTGLTFPGWGICFAYVIDLLYWPVLECTNDTLTIVNPDGTATLVPLPNGTLCETYWDAEADDMKALSLNITWGLLGLMVVSILGGIFLFYGFGKASEKMNKRVRNAAFDSLVRQEVGYFDLRPVGLLTSQLQEDAALIHSFSGEPIRTLVINLSSVLVGVAISFGFMWPFALLALALIPPMGFGAEMEMKMYFGEDEGVGDDVRQNSPGGIVVETLVNIRTVASLTIEKKRSQQYAKALRAEDPTPIKTNFIKGCATGIGQFTQMWGLALLFWFGGWLLTTYPESFTFRDYLISLFSLLFGLEGMGFAAQGATDRKKAKAAANRIFELIDRHSAIDPLSDEGKKNV